MLSSKIIPITRGLPGLYGPKCLLKSTVLVWPTSRFSHLTEVLGMRSSSEDWWLGCLCI